MSWISWVWISAQDCSYQTGTCSAWARTAAAAGRTFTSKLRWQTFPFFIEKEAGVVLFQIQIQNGSGYLVSAGRPRFQLGPSCPKQQRKQVKFSILLLSQISADDVIVTLETSSWSHGCTENWAMTIFLGNSLPLSTVLWWTGWGLGTVRTQREQESWVRKGFIGRNGWNI